MGDRRRKPKRNEQLLLRLTEEEYAVLRSLAHLEGSKSPNECAYQLLSRHLLSIAKDPLVRTDLENQAAFRERSGARVVRLNPRSAT